MSCNDAATLGHNTWVTESSRRRQAQTFLNHRSEIHQLLNARVGHLVFALERSADFGRNFVPDMRILDEVIGRSCQECARGFATCKQLGSQNTDGEREPIPATTRLVKVESISPRLIPFSSLWRLT